MIVVNNIYEHDIDLFIAQLFHMDRDFKNLFIAEDANVISVELSKTDSKLGESDITVILENSSHKIGLLIEDKIDAIAMPKQPERYIERGKLGVNNGDYDEFLTIIVCPEKYYNGNVAAKKYGKAVLYETIVEYLKNNNSGQYDFFIQAFEQALYKAKNPSNVTINDTANAFFREYRSYLKENYAGLDLRTKEDSNGYWPRYATRLNRAYIYHKVFEGRVDLTFPDAGKKNAEMEILANWLQVHGITNVRAEVTGKAGALTIYVPSLNTAIPFENNNENDIRNCFDAIKVLTDAANIFALANEVSNM